VDEAKLISRQIAETRIEIGVCTRLKSKNIMMRLGKPVGDLLVAYEMKLVDLENQLQALSRKASGKPAAPSKPSAPVVPKAPAPVSTKPPVPAPKPAPPIPRPILVVRSAPVVPAKPGATAPTKPAIAAPAKPVAAAPAPVKAALANKSAASEPKAAPRKATPSASKSRK